MKQQFIKNGYEIVEYEEKADIYIVNTCTVTNMSDKKSRNILRRAKQINPKSILVVVGCYVQVGKQELEKIEDIDIILGNNEKNEIVEFIKKYENEKKQEITQVNNQVEFLDFGSVTYTDKTRAVIKIQDGCDKFCSYCIIPYARGRVRSRKKDSIIKEISTIVENGIKEIVITGIHIASYGKDFKQDYFLIDLLEDINKIENLKRIRLGSIEPTIITQEFVNRLQKLDKICEHFHLSLQSGCNDTLKRMNRKYTVEEFENGVKLLRKAYKNVSLTTDIIVGFPGETEEEFTKTYEFLRTIKFYKMHIFKYSKRKGTKAAIMPNQVDREIQEKRSQRLVQLSNLNQKKYNESYVGKNVLVLFEEKNGKYYKGHTSNYIMVMVESEKELQNEMKIVKIENIREEELIGNILEEK